MSGLLGVLGALVKYAPGLIKEIEVGEDSRVTIIENGGVPIRLSSLESPGETLSNLSEVLRIISGDRKNYSEVVLSSSGESHILLKPEAAQNETDMVDT